MPETGEDRWRRPAKIAMLVIAVPVATILASAVLGALVAALDRSCEVGIGSFCGVRDRARIFATFLGGPIVILYFVVLATVGLRSRS